MDFVKNNLFYVVLVAAVLVVSIPSYILAGAREAKHQAAVSQAKGYVSGFKSQADKLKPVSPEALKRAEEYQKEWAAQIKQVEEMMKTADKHLDYEFLLPAEADTGLPPAGEYKIAYGKAYDELLERLTAAGMLEKGALHFGQKVDWGDRLPDARNIRISQKQYWILKELADIFTDPECHIAKVTEVTLDIVPGAGENHPDNEAKPAESRFWIYPMTIDLQMDFRYFPELLRKLAANDNVAFIVSNYQITRAFEDSEPVYEPTVAVSIYCTAWDYISSDFEKSLRDQWKPGSGGPAGGGGRKRGR